MNKSWKQHPLKQQFYGHLHPISKTIEIRWSRYVGHWKKSKDELRSVFLPWNPSHGRAGASLPARTYLQQL